MIKRLAQYGLVGLLFIWGGTTAFSQTPEALFQSANDHYAQARYAEAISDYEKILDQDLVSAAIYYNLANAHYKLNNVGETVYYFEKALQLAPGDPDIRNNAAFAENMKIDAIEKLPENTVKKWVDNTLSLLTFDGWAITSIVTLSLFVLLFLGYYFSYITLRKRVFFITAISSILLAVVSLSFAYTAFAKAQSDQPAIVFVPEVTIKSEPSPNSPTAFTLHEGTKVMVLETIESWKRIQIVDGQVGWIEETDIKLLNDFKKNVTKNKK